MSMKKRRVLIIQDDRTQSGNLQQWTQEVADELKLDVEIVPVLRDHVDEFKKWFDDYYPPPAPPEEYEDRHWNVLILDIIFKEKDGEKQALGGSNSGSG